MDADYRDDSDSDGDAAGGDYSSDEENDLGVLLRKSSSMGVSRGMEKAVASLRAFEQEEDTFEDEVGKEFDATFALVEHDAGIRTLQARIKKDPLFDPKSDERDEAWVNARRQRYQPKQPRGSEQKKLPHSDAVLNCPCCMTMLCLDCQRHAKFTNQYRAMFVFNCKVNFDETLKIPEGVDKKQLKKLKWKGRKRKHGDEAEASTSGESSMAVALPSTSTAAGSDDFHPVGCAACGTRVAVYDSDEVYHFFHVLASH